MTTPKETPKKAATTGSTLASTTSGLLSVLEGSNGIVTLAITVAGILIPLGKALIQKIEGIGTGSVTITFANLVIQDDAELDAITALSTADLAAINAELTRLGLPTLPAAPPTTGS